MDSIHPYFNNSSERGESRNSSKLDDNGLNTGLRLDDSSSAFSEAKVLKGAGDLSSYFEECNKDFLNFHNNQKDLTEEIQEMKKMMTGLMTEITFFNNKTETNQDKIHLLEQAFIKNKKKISKMKKRVRSQEERIYQIERRLSTSPCLKHPSSKFVNKYIKLFFINKQNFQEIKCRTLNAADFNLSSTKSNTHILIKKKLVIK